MSQDLRDRLRAEEKSLLGKYSDRIDTIERLRPLFAIVGIVGAFIAALSRAWDAPVGIAIAVGGAVTALVGGGVAALLDYRKLELGREAKSAHGLADEAIALADARETRLSEVESVARKLDTKRRERLLAIEQMVEAVEAGLLRQAAPAETAEKLLQRSISAIRKAVDYEAHDFFTVSIFRRESAGDHEVMRRIAAQWTDPARAGLGGRTWALGKGYTGVAWRNGLTNSRGDVIEPDTLACGVARQYPVDHGDPEREKLYRSVAAIPILVRGTNEVWGVVTATSDRPGVFGRDRTNLSVQNVDMIRDIARVAALLAGFREPQP